MINVNRVLAALAMLFSCNLQSVAQATLIDIWPGWGESAPSDLAVYNGKLYFRASSASNGIELWSYDGSTAAIEADINLGVGESNPNFLTVYDGKLYFCADDGNSGHELWSYDGTTATLVSDILPGSESSNPSYLVVYNGKLFFRATSYNYERELWSYDGNTVEQVADINPGDSSSDPWQFCVFDGNLYFRAQDGVNGAELWMYDGTIATLVQDINIGSNSSQPAYLTVYSGKLFFRANDGINGVEIWSYNGTNATLEADIWPGNESSLPNDFTHYNNKLFFTATDGVNGFELWSYDGITAVLEADIFPGSGSSGFGAYGAVYAGKLYFAATDTYNDIELWSYDGTSAALAVEVNPNTSGGSYPQFFTVFDGKLYFQADNGINGAGRELWSLCLPTSSQNDSVTLCPGENYTFHDGFSLNNITSQTEHSSVLENIGGCDSVIQTMIQLYPIYSQADSATICRHESYLFHDGTVEVNIISPITHTSYLNTVNGCDSIIETAINVFNVDTSITDSGVTLFANATLASYQWLDCNQSYTPIFNETGQAFEPSTTGSYAVEITHNSCVDTSSCYVFILSNISESVTSNPSIYPNPTKGALVIDLGSPSHSTKFSVFNARGLLIHSELLKAGRYFNYELPETKGLYLLQMVRDDGSINSIKVLRE